MSAMNEYLDIANSSKDWLKAHKDEYEECLKLIDDKEIDEQDREYCICVIKEYSEEMKKLKLTLNHIDEEILNGNEITETERKFKMIY